MLRYGNLRYDHSDCTKYPNQSLLEFAQRELDAACCTVRHYSVDRRNRDNIPTLRLLIIAQFLGVWKGPEREASQVGCQAQSC